MSGEKMGEGGWRRGGLPQACMCIPPTLEFSLFCLFALHIISPSLILLQLSHDDYLR